MDFLNLNLNPDQLKGYQQELDELKKPSIPAGHLMKMMLIGADCTKAGKERAALEGRPTNIMDGVSLEFIILGYYKDAQTYIPIIDISNLDDIKFPFEGDIGVRAFLFFTTKSLVYQGYKEPKDVASTEVLFRQWLDRQIGVTPADKVTEGLIVFARRYIDHYYKKDDLVNGEPKKGAKQQTSFVITCYNREADENQPVPVQYIDGEGIVKIGTAVIEHIKQHAKKDGADAKVEGVPF